VQVTHFFPKRQNNAAVFLRKYRYVWALMFTVFCVLPLAADQYVASVADADIYDDLQQIPERRVALVLGTSKWAPSGRVNLFYRYRIEAALALYQAGKVERILVSGDNSRVGYDEPTQMRDDLVELGVPADHVFRDYAGFRTLDSVIRAKKVFGLDSFIIVSQRFHCLRAVYLAQAADIDAIGFSAREVGGTIGFKIRLREILARTQAVVDLNVLNRQPKFLGPEEIIP
jgi:SanA protein